MNKSCPSCQIQLSAEEMLCPSCGFKFQSPAAFGLKATVRPASRPKIPVEVDLAATVDRTGSSLAFEQGIKRGFEMLVDPVQAKAAKLRVWLQTHGDLDYGQEPVLLTNGGTAEQAKQDTQTIHFDGGGDAAEHHLDGIEHMLNTVPWTADMRRARGVIVAFLTAESKPARSGRSARAIGEEIKRRGLLLYLVCEETPELKALCDAASGWMIQISNNPEAGQFQQAAAQVAASIIATVGAGGTVPMTKQALMAAS